MQHSGSGSGAGKGALTGLGVGAGVGALFGLAALMIPGVGPFIAAGALAEVLGVAGATVASGALVGGATGSLAGALTRAGLHEPDAKHYADAVDRGEIYVGVDTVQAPLGDEVLLEALRRTGGEVRYGASPGPTAEGHLAAGTPLGNDAQHLHQVSAENAGFSVPPVGAVAGSMDLADRQFPFLENAEQVHKDHDADEDVTLPVGGYRR